jgi:hypothetical protein
VAPHVAHPSARQGSSFAGWSDGLSGYSGPASRGRSSADSYNNHKTNPRSRASKGRGAYSAAHNRQRHQRTGYRSYTYKPRQNAAPPAAVEQKARKTGARRDPPPLQLLPRLTLPRALRAPKARPSADLGPSCRGRSTPPPSEAEWRSPAVGAGQGKRSVSHLDSLTRPPAPLDSLAHSCSRVGVSTCKNLSHTGAYLWGGPPIGEASFVAVPPRATSGVVVAKIQSLLATPPYPQPLSGTSLGSKLSRQSRDQTLQRKLQAQETAAATLQNNQGLQTLDHPPCLRHNSPTQHPPHETPAAQTPCQKGQCHHRAHTPS